MMTAKQKKNKPKHTKKERKRKKKQRNNNNKYNTEKSLNQTFNTVPTTNLAAMFTNN